MVRLKTQKQQLAVKQVLDPSNEYEGLLYGGLDIDAEGICIHVYKASCVEITFEQMQKILDIICPKVVFDMSMVAPEMRGVVEEWLQYKKEKGQSYKPTGLKTFYKRLCRLSNNNPQIAEEIIEESISSGYSGIYPPKNHNQYQYGRPKTNTEKFHDTIKSANEFSKKLHENVGKQTEVGNGDNDALW